jgi:hypothetical protein
MPLNFVGLSPDNKKIVFEELNLDLSSNGMDDLKKDWSPASALIVITMYAQTCLQAETQLMPMPARPAIKTKEARALHEGKRGEVIAHNNNIKDIRALMPDRQISGLALYAGLQAYCQVADDAAFRERFENSEGCKYFRKQLEENAKANVIRPAGPIRGLTTTAATPL